MTELNQNSGGFTPENFSDFTTVSWRDCFVHDAFTFWLYDKEPEKEFCIAPIDLEELHNDGLLGLTYEEIKQMREKAFSSLPSNDFTDLVFAVIRYTVYFVAAATQSISKDDRS